MVLAIEYLPSPSLSRYLGCSKLRRVRVFMCELDYTRRAKFLPGYDASSRCVRGTARLGSVACRITFSPAQRWAASTEPGLEAGSRSPLPNSAPQDRIADFVLEARKPRRPGWRGRAVKTRGISAVPRDPSQCLEGTGIRPLASGDQSLDLVDRRGLADPATSTVSGHGGGLLSCPGDAARVGRLNVDAAWSLSPTKLVPPSASGFGSAPFFRLGRMGYDPCRPDVRRSVIAPPSYPQPPGVSEAAYILGKPA